MTEMNFVFFIRGSVLVLFLQEKYHLRGEVETVRSIIWSLCAYARYHHEGKCADIEAGK